MIPHRRLLHNCYLGSSRKAEGFTPGDRKGGTRTRAKKRSSSLCRPRRHRPVCGHPRLHSPYQKATMVEHIVHIDGAPKPKRPQCGMKQGGGVLSKGASQAAAPRGDHCEADRSKRSAARPQVRVLLRPPNGRSPENQGFSFILSVIELDPQKWTKV